MRFGVFPVVALGGGNIDCNGHWAGGGSYQKPVVSGCGEAVCRRQAGSEAEKDRRSGKRAYAVNEAGGII